MMRGGVWWCQLQHLHACIVCATCILFMHRMLSKLEHPVSVVNLESFKGEYWCRVQGLGMHFNLRQCGQAADLAMCSILFAVKQVNCIIFGLSKSLSSLSPWHNHLCSMTATICLWHCLSTCQNSAWILVNVPLSVMEWHWAAQERGLHCEWCLVTKVLTIFWLNYKRVGNALVSPYAHWKLQLCSQSIQ